ncbi:MAG: SRPBCC family protein [Actinomycetota bacterium]|nr:MAG: SRPBCC family protein [Actinomycetota bacterium]
MTELRVDLAVRAPQHVVFDALTQWPSQGAWMVATTVELISGDGRGPGSVLRAVTGRGPLRVVDTMTVSAWEPPDRVEVRHTGRVVRGLGIFEVQAMAADRSRLVWTERLDVPLGWLGRCCWLLLRPLVAAGIRRSLRTFAELVAAGELPATGRT